MRFKEYLKEEKLDEGFGNDAITYKDYTIYIGGSIRIAIWKCYTKEEANKITNFLSKQIHAGTGYAKDDLKPRITIDEGTSYIWNEDEFNKIQKAVKGKIERL